MIESIALLIPKDRTIEQAKGMLYAIFDGDNIVSRSDDEFEDRGYGFVLDYYAKDRNHIWKIIKDAGFVIDKETMAEWEVEE